MMVEYKHFKIKEFVLFMIVMDPIKIIKIYYKPGSKAYNSLVNHSKQVTKKALWLARRVPESKPDITFIKEASMLHDIGIKFCNAPDIGCNGKEPYIKHGILGARLLRKEGYPRHALVCERHVGVGIRKKDVIRQNLPLPRKDMIPKTIEEEIVCFADKFFTKKPGLEKKEYNVNDIRKEARQYGKDKLDKVNELKKKFKIK
jgi:uncharacterized protein